MGKYTRNVRLKAYNGFYKSHHSLSDYICFYCDDAADTKDHIPPLEMTYRLGPETFKSLLLVRACRWCNTKLGPKPLTTIKERQKYITEQLRKKLDSLGPEWSDDDVKEMGLDLRQMIEDRRIVRDWLRRRIEYASTDRS